MEVAGSVVTCCLISLLSSALMTTRIIASECEDGSDLCSIDCTFVQPMTILCECKCEKLQGLGVDEAGNITSATLMLRTNPPENCSTDLLTTTCVFHKNLSDPLDEFEIDLILKNSNLEEVFSICRSFSFQTSVRYSPPGDITLKYPDPLTGTIDVVWSFPVDYPPRATYLDSYSHCMVRVSDGGEPWTTSQSIPENHYYTLRNLEPFSWYAVQVTCFCYFSGKLNWSHNVTFKMPGLIKTTVKPLPTQQRTTITFLSQNAWTFSWNQTSSEETTEKCSQANVSSPRDPTGTGVTLIYDKEPLDIRRLLRTLGVCGAVLAVVCLLAAVLSVMCRTRRNVGRTEFISEFSGDIQSDENYNLTSTVLGSSHCDKMLTENRVGNDSDYEEESA